MASLRAGLPGLTPPADDLIDTPQAKLLVGESLRRVQLVRLQSLSAAQKIPVGKKGQGTAAQASGDRTFIALSTPV